MQRTKTILDEMLKTDQSMLIIGPTLSGKSKLLVDFLIALQDQQRNAKVYYISERDPNATSIATLSIKEVNRRMQKYGDWHPSPLWVICDSYPLNLNIQRTIIQGGRAINTHLLRAVQSCNVADTGLPSPCLRAMKILEAIDVEPSDYLTNFKWKD